MTCRARVEVCGYLLNPGAFAATKSSTFLRAIHSERDLLSLPEVEHDDSQREQNNSGLIYSTEHHAAPPSLAAPKSAEVAQFYFGADILGEIARVAPFGGLGGRSLAHNRRLKIRAETSASMSPFL